nr:hypothetical protein HK105_001731 [Polyrhizophydium stewartii]
MSASAGSRGGASGGLGHLRGVPGVGSVGNHGGAGAGVSGGLVVGAGPVSASGGGIGAGVGGLGHGGLAKDAFQDTDTQVRICPTLYNNNNPDATQLRSGIDLIQDAFTRQAAALKHEVTHWKHIASQNKEQVGPRAVAHRSVAAWGSR